ncbi:hypothetical protein [Candidatus Tisiphia endosymbiont of Hybos culiciformis]|uniref:hypothetical protein n=1 Tax=Candidatus Tisiphia endosymbiont of Hybos culiciformis TaxID=3139331 RepID=UPI003CCB447A
MPCRSEAAPRNDVYAFLKTDSYIVNPIELGDTNFVLTLRKQVSRFPPQLGMTTYNRYVLYHLIL